MCRAPVARAMVGALSLQPWQWGALALAYALLFVAPAFWIWKRARRDGDESPFVWTMLVLVGSLLGVAEYFHHRSILKRRARRAERAAQARERDAARDEPPPGGS